MALYKGHQLATPDLISIQSKLHLHKFKYVYWIRTGEGVSLTAIYSSGEGGQNLFCTNV